MYSLLLGILVSSVLCACSPYDSSEDREGIALESGRFPNRPESRIIGGDAATIEEYPFAVSLQNNGTFYGHEVEHFCGGSIIGEKWIITSAQCAQHILMQNSHVRAGTSYYYKNGDIYNVETVTIHPMFDEINYDYDIALIKLTRSIKYDRTRQPIKLTRKNSSINDGTLIDTLGWGATKILGPVSDELRHSKVMKISDRECEYIYGGVVLTKRMFCILSDKVSPCIGDSGSPAIFNGTLVGVTSWSRSCAYEYPTAYTAIFEVANWITEITGIS